jgi:hypothetical protein
VTASPVRGRRRRAAGATWGAAWLLSLAPATAAAQRAVVRPLGPPIDSIAFTSRNVFDPDEADKNLLFALMNAFHIKTQRYVVGQELLFAEGEAYDSAAVAETARNLRALGLFRDVDIDTVRVNGLLVLRVNTADAWTTTVQAEAQSTGGQLEWGLGLKEKNLLGTATLGRAKFRNKVDREEVTLEASQNRLFGTGIRAHTRFDLLSDGDNGEWTFGVPFRAFGDRQSWELPGRFALRRELQFRDGALFRQFWHRMFRQSARVAFAPVADEMEYLRVGGTAQVKRDEYLAIADTSLAIPDTVRAAFAGFVEFAKARFKVTQYYLAFRRDVDVDLSTRAAFSLWVAPEPFGYDRWGVGPSLQAQTAVSIGKNFVKFEIDANGLFTSAGLDSGQVKGIVTAVSQILPRQATVIRVEATVQDDPAPSREIDLGLGVGLRGFAAHAFTGTRSIWGTIEQRLFLVDEFLDLFGIGLAGFLDYGGAWFPDQPVRLGGNAGFGLRLSSVRAGDVTVGRLDLAYRFGEGFDGNRWVFTFGRAVSF